jgi:hypothetical protein
MGLKVYGASDDLIEFDSDDAGGFHGEMSWSEPTMIVLSDGTLLKARYEDDGIWHFTLITQGKLFKTITRCISAADDPHSDVVEFDAGVKWAFWIREWERVS